MGEDEVPGDADSLTGDELNAVVRLVDALVDKDEPFLREAGAYDHGGDPFLWTRHWRLWDQVDLVRPPGDPRAWELEVIRGNDNQWAGIQVEMWTTQEGRSDLTLEIDLLIDAGGTPKAVFRNLHVM